MDVGKDIWLFEGASLTSSLLKFKLIDEIGLAIHPVLLGGKCTKRGIAKYKKIIMEFNFKEKFTLENDKVLLRPLELSDKAFLMEYAINEPEIWKFNSNGAEGVEKFEKYIANAITQRDNEKEYPFIVLDKSSGKYVGSTRFYAVFLELKTIEIGYTWYSKHYQGTGINKNCKYLLLEFAFEKMKMERVAFAANTKNEKSINTMKSIGCVVEGVLRNSNIGAFGERIDVIRLSILNSEWKDSVKSNLKTRI